RAGAGHPAGRAGAHGTDGEILGTLMQVNRAKAPAVKLAMLEGLGEGMRSGDSSLGQWLAKPSDVAEVVIEDILPLVRQAPDNARNEKKKLAAPLPARRVLGFGPFKIVGEPLAEVLNPRFPVEVQSAALRALAGFNDPNVGPLILGQWDSYGPTLRREATEALFARSDRLKALLDAVEAKKVPPAHIESTRVEALRKHSDSAIRSRASQLFTGQLAPDRKKELDEYRPALDLNGDL